MLFISRLTLIDVAEAQDTWLARVRRQWKWGARSLLAVRVRDEGNVVLGSTVPKPLGYIRNGPAPAWGTAWALREPHPPKTAEVHPATAHATETRQDECVSHRQRDEVVDADDTTAAPTEGLTNTHTATVPHEAEGRDPTTTVADAEALTQTNTTELPPSQLGNEATERVSNGMDELQDEGTTIQSREQNELPPTVTSREAEGGEGEGTNNNDASRGEGRDGAEDGEAGGDGVVIQLTGDTSHARLVFEVLTLMGEVVATAVVDISAALLSPTKTNTAVVQPFAVLLTPCGVRSVGPDTVYALLEFAVMSAVQTTPKPEEEHTRSEEEAAEGSNENTNGEGISPMADMHAALRTLRDTPMPLAVQADCVTLSTNDLYYPACFLTELGTYIVSNVICIENVSAHTVRLEFVITGDSSIISFAPSSLVTLTQQGERAYVVCTWNMFRPLQPLHRSFTRYIKHSQQQQQQASAVGMHVLVHEEDVSRPSIDIHIHHEAPQADEKTRQYAPFCFFVNRTMVSNVPCSHGELALVRPLLPIYAVAADEIDELPLESQQV